MKVLCNLPQTTSLISQQQSKDQGRKCSFSSLCNIQVLYLTVTTQQSSFTLQVAAGKQLFIAEYGMIISPAQGPGWHSPRCSPVHWREEGSATSALSHQWRSSPGGLCLGQWSCSSHRTDPKWCQIVGIQRHTHPNNCRKPHAGVIMETCTGK